MKNTSCLIILLLCVIIYMQSCNEPFKFMKRFALTGDIVYAEKNLDPNTYYLVGTRSKSNTIVDAQNGGITCPEFPVTVYKKAPVENAKCVDTKGDINSPNVDDTFYSYSTTAVLGVNISPRYFTTKIDFIIPVTTTISDTSTKDISYNTNGTVLIVGNTSGNLYWSSNFGTSTQSFNLISGGTNTFNNASIGMGNFYVGGRLTPSNDNLLMAGTTTGSMYPIQNGSSYYYGTQQAIGTVTGIQGYVGTPDNVLMTIGLNGRVFLQQQGAFWYRIVWSQDPAKASSISLDQTVATIVQYTPASGTSLPQSIIYMVSLQPGGNVANAPGGIGAEISTLGTAGFKKVVGNPNNIVYLCAGEDLRAFAINSDGNILICNNIAKASSPSDWIILPLDKVPPKFKKVFYRKTVNDIAYALDNDGKVYVQRNVDAMFKQMFNLTV
jgi:hypothetical protein